MKTIETLTKEWGEMVESLWKCEFIDIDEIKKLSRETFNIMHEYSNKDYVPKEMCELILEMRWFAWWVADAECTPMHGLYQELGNIVTALHCHLRGDDEEYNDIEPFLDKL